MSPTVRVDGRDVEPGADAKTPTQQMLRRSNAVAYHHQPCPGDARAHDEPRLGPTRSAPSVGARAACVRGRRRPPSAAARGRLLPGSLIATTRHQGKEPT